jgi:hypothetical protein
MDRRAGRSAASASTACGSRRRARGCGQFVVFDLDKLIAQVGEDYPLPDGPGMACERCGAELKFQPAVWHSDHEQDE